VFSARSLPLDCAGLHRGHRDAFRRRGIGEILSLSPRAVNRISGTGISETRCDRSTRASRRARLARLETYRSFLKYDGKMPSDPHFFHIQALDILVVLQLLFPYH
jgi:hypothetical protein